MAPLDQPKVDTSPKVSDEIRKTTCYMCACRCGINVHMKDGRVAYIEGNRDHPVNKGVLCAKGSAGIMQVNAPSRLRAPLRRVGPRGYQSQQGNVEPLLTGFLSPTFRPNQGCRVEQPMALSRRLLATPRALNQGNLYLRLCSSFDGDKAYLSSYGQRLKFASGISNRS